MFNTSRNKIPVQVLKPWKFVQESSEEVLFIKARQMYLSRFNMWNLTDILIVVSVENYKIQISKSVFHTYPSYVFSFSFLTTLDIYKDYFKGRLT